MHIANVLIAWFCLKLHIDSAQEASDTNKKDEDFFAECENDNGDAFSVSNNNYESTAVSKVSWLQVIAFLIIHPVEQRLMSRNESVSCLAIV